MSGLMEYLQGRGVTFVVMPHAPAATSLEEADALGLAPDEIVKTVVVACGFGHALMVIPASRRLEMKLVREAVGDPEARLATESELARALPEYEPGALPPLGLFLLAPMYVDPECLTRDSVVFAAGRQTVSIRMATRDLFRGDPVVITPLTAAPRSDRGPGVEPASTAG